MAGALPQGNVKVAPPSSWPPSSAASVKTFSKVMMMLMMLSILRLIISWRDVSEYKRMSQDDNDFSSASKGPTSASASAKSFQIQNLHMAFVGDSLTRYQYMSFVHFVQTGRWIKNVDAPNMIHHAGMTWYQYYSNTEQLWNGTETCDCYRPDGPWFRVKKRVHVISENRYYRHIERNNYISVIQKFGHIEAHGHWDPSQVYNSHHAVNLTSPDVRGRAFAWRFHNWQDIIRLHLAKLDPKPTIVLLNAGRWPHDLDNVTNVHAIRRALDEHGMVGIYKTTTKIKTDTSTNIDSYEIEACKILHYCLDMSWTGTLSNNSDYVDLKHFSALVNRRFNEQLIDLLEKIR
jgi:hypothetical protein